MRTNKQTNKHEFDVEKFNK